MSKTKIVEDSFPLYFELPADFVLTEGDLHAIKYRAGQFILWELNELIRLRTGRSDWFGRSAMEEREKQNEKQA